MGHPARGGNVLSELMLMKQVAFFRFSWVLRIDGAFDIGGCRGGKYLKDQHVTFPCRSLSGISLCCVLYTYTQTIRMTITE